MTDTPDARPDLRPHTRDRVHAGGVVWTPAEPGHTCACGEAALYHDGNHYLCGMCERYLYRRERERRG